MVEDVLQCAGRAGALAVHCFLHPVRHSVDVCLKEVEGRLQQAAGIGGGDVHHAVLQQVAAGGLAGFIAHYKGIAGAVGILDIHLGGAHAGEAELGQVFLLAQVLAGLNGDGHVHRGGHLGDIHVIALVAVDGKVHRGAAGRALLRGAALLGRSGGAVVHRHHHIAGVGVLHGNGGHLAGFPVGDHFGSHQGAAGGVLVRCGLGKQQHSRAAAQHHQHRQHDDEIANVLLHRLTGASSSGKSPSRRPKWPPG